MKNVFWLRHICEIGGVEEFEYQLVKKYDNDIYIYYETGNKEQINRLRKFCKVIKWEKGTRIKCDKFFTNYDFFTIIDYVDANEYIQIVHADFKRQAKVKENTITPHLHDKITSYIAVSNVVKEGFAEVTGIDANDISVCHNPLQLTDDERRPTLMLGSFTRLSPEKGGDRMLKLIEKLDAIPNFNYIWFIYSNGTLKTKSKNVVAIPPRLNGITNMMCNLDAVVQLSTCEGWSYTVNQALHLGIPIVYTPCPSFYEMGVDKIDYNIELDYDCTKLDEVVNKLVKMYNNKRIREYPELSDLEDVWDKHLIPGPKDYKLDDVLIRVLSRFTDKELNEVKEKNEEYTVSEDRAKYLVERGLVEIIREKEKND